MKTNHTLPPEILRIIDANSNRLKEAIRVIEDIARYYDNNKKMAKSLKTLRHKAKINNLQTKLVDSRDSYNDVLKESTQSEMIRDNLQDIVTANFKRAQESARVLEEMLKLLAHSLSANFKNIRYELYQLEKEFSLLPNKEN